MAKVGGWLPLEAMRVPGTSAEDVGQVQRARWHRALEEAFLRQPVKNGMAPQARASGSAGDGAAPGRQGLSSAAPVDYEAVAGVAPADQAGPLQAEVTSLSGAPARWSARSGAYPVTAQPAAVPRAQQLQSAVSDRLMALRTAGRAERSDWSPPADTWQATNVTVAVGENGARVWIRDAELGKLPRDVLRRWVADALAQHGVRLDVLVCNGETVAL